MKKKVGFSLGIFTILCLAIVPFHLEATKTIVDRQAHLYDRDTIEGYQLDEERLHELKFHPREYIRIQRRSE
ncbi:hypothetical protein JSY36_15535 [Bacillus sp. H-16]|uniref:hypothetical protein n=1 Tax=Alteribacter salitolerans TaxID=2912333 RepID=UPI001963DD30|nr:hypothetical protein [Alteribacter salitolerans]MBM7097145.1 hypothetical protein [Alteribacter salitolerans]